MPKIGNKFISLWDKKYFSEWAKDYGKEVEKYIEDYKKSW